MTLPVQSRPAPALYTYGPSQTVNGGVMSTVDLNELLDYAGEFATQQLVGKKAMVAWCILVDVTGERTPVAVETGNRFENISQFAKVRQLIRDRGAIAYAWVSEAWTSSEPGIAQPSEDPRRQEIVIAMASDGFNSVARQWDIRRDYKGAVVALAQAHETLATFGPLANLLGQRA